MNDPNGLFYDKSDKTWHLYYQNNPNDTIWGVPLSWGHATSKDLVCWNHHNLAISPDDDNSGIFSGSIVIDHNNTSGLFDKSIDINKRVVAIYTTATHNIQTQNIAYSLDGGYSFKKYHGNPVIDVNSPEFRDPKVIWHKETNQWIMVVVKAKDYKIQIWGSLDLKNWTFHSDFSSGYFGNMYECPILAKVLVEGTQSYKWVMFVSINPGSPVGGSINQYFIGEFDGYRFTPMDTFTRFMDMGQDFYAFHTFSATGDEVVGLAWASNWLYASEVPTHPWRGSMTLARIYSLKWVYQSNDTKLLTLIQNPILEGSGIKQTNILDIKLQLLVSNKPIIATTNSGSGLLDFRIKFKVLAREISSRDNRRLDILIKANFSSEYSIRIGFDASVSSFYVERQSCGDIQKNPFFRNKFSVHTEPLCFNDHGNRIYEVRGVIDKNIFELYFNEGSLTMTNTFFMAKDELPSQFELHCDRDELFEIEYLYVKDLKVL